MQRQRDDAPEERVLGHTRQPERRDAEAEEEDDEDARAAPGRGRRRRSRGAGSGRTPGPAGCAGPRCARPEDEDQASAIRKSWTLTRNAQTIRGHASANSSPLKNDSWTAGQFGALTTSTAEQPEDRQRAGEGDPAGAPPHGGRLDPADYWSSGAPCARDPLVAITSSVPSSLSACDGRVHARGQRAALVEQDAEVLDLGAGARSAASRRSAPPSSCASRM